LTGFGRYLGRGVGPALFLVGAIVVVLLPRFMGEFRLLQFTRVAILVIAILGLNILTGYSGQISLGHYALVGVGAYITALLSLGRPGLELFQLDPPSWMPIGDGMRPIFTIPIAALVTGILGFLIGIPALRLGGISLALATLAVAARSGAQDWCVRTGAIFP
jgi:branched-chain amino acid transport system permease protein